ncbi:methyltransferase [Rathayibacter sp. YIM 133350]|uniref:DUF7059 domain-containing protein n=1 Tax=Rathayibacter sp. YIM 133350 TaxID=3131992 RepID=UPI00307EC67A
MSLVDDLRTDLAAAGYTVAALDSLWGPDAATALHRGHRVPARRALEAHRDRLLHLPPVAVLAQLFVLGMAVPRSALAEALPTLTVTGAEELGLVASVAPSSRGAGHIMRPSRDLRPYAFTDAAGDAHWWIISDLGELVSGGPLRQDHVLGVGGASLTLSGLMFTSAVESVLDLGTGCGIQAMHAARHAGRVVATDISRRALWIAELNARLNEIDNIEFRAGSLFEPVAGERFDRIVSNPPFVITPRVEGVPEYEYRDGGRVGDALVREVLTGAADHLVAGGTAQLLGNWEYHAQVDGLARVAGWLDGVGLEYWVIEREVQSPAEYAETWIRDGGTRPGHDFDRLYEAWLDDFRLREVASVGFGYVVLRRPAGTPALRRTEALHGPLGEAADPLGNHLERCLAGIDALGSDDEDADARLAEARLVVAPDVTEERHYWPGEENPTAIVLHQGGGFGRAIAADTGLAALVGASDGELPVGAIIGALAELLEIEPSALADALLPAVRELVAGGILSPSSSSRG